VLRFEKIARKNQRAHSVRVAGAQALPDDTADRQPAESEAINAQVVGTNRSATNQNLCRQEKTVGSHMVYTRCATQQEIDDARDGTRLFLEKPKICSGQGCGADE
jgi:hypothetical protein